MKYLVVYTSKTGNTQKLAMEMFAAIPDTSKDFYDISELPQDKEADVYFIGFWIDRGTCSMEILDFISELHGKKVALFGTCGMGSHPDYYHTIEEKIKVFLPEDNQYLGSFLCQGKMPIQVRQKYEAMQQKSDNPNIEKLLRNFDEALIHPNQADFEQAKKFVHTALKSI